MKYKKVKTPTLIPNVSIGNILFGDNIENYSDRQYEYSDTIGKDAYSSYSFRDTPVSAYVDKNGLIESISCETECLWQGINLIGLQFEQFTSLYPKQFNDKDCLSVILNKSGDEQDQEIYDYDELGLQLWVFEGVIVTVLASSYQEHAE